MIHPDEVVATLMDMGLPEELAAKIAHYVGTPTAKMIQDHYNAHPNLSHWEIPRRFGNFIVDEVCQAFLCCCTIGQECSGKKLAMYCTMCKVGLCADHMYTGCWCSVLMGLRDSGIALQSVVRTTAFSSGRYRLDSPYRTFYTKAHLRSALRETIGGGHHDHRDHTPEFCSEITRKFLS